MAAAPSRSAQPAAVPVSVDEGHAWQWSGPPRLDTVRDAVRGACDFMRRHGVDEASLSAWELALTEAGNNAVFYVGDATAAEAWEMHVFVTAAHAVVRMVDHTPGFDWPDEVTLPDPESETGRGLFLITSLTDFQRYDRGRDANVLTLHRRHDPVPVKDGNSEDLTAQVKELESTLEAMTDELSASYESLAAIFHFSRELGGTQSLGEFASRLLDHLATVTGSETGCLRMVGDDGALCTMAECGDRALSARAFGELEGAAVETRQDQWIEARTIRAGAGPASGLVHPFYDGDRLMGVVSLGRHERAEAFRAGEVNVVHTFAEFFCQQVLRRRHEEAAVKAELTRRELELAASIQRSLLPRSMPCVPGLALTAHFESAYDVGGDYYDVMQEENGNVVFVVADVMGKGVGASIMAAVTRSVFRSLRHLGDCPNRLMEKAAALLWEDLDRLEMFVTAAVGHVDVGRGLICMANAGHCPAILLPAGGGVPQEVPGGGLPLGLSPAPTFEDLVVPFGPGARLVAFTDGLTDPRDARGAFHSVDDFRLWLGQAGPAAGTVDALRLRLLDRLRQDSSHAPLADDQTFLICGNTR